MKKPKGKYAWTVTVGEKGQIVIPKQARDVFDIKPGDTLVILGDEKKDWQFRQKTCLRNLPPPFSIPPPTMKERNNHEKILS